MNKKRYVSIPCYYKKWKVFMSIWYVSTTNMSQYHLLSVGLRRKRRIGSGKMWTGNLHLIHTLIFVTYVFSLSLIRFLMINAYMLLTFTGPFTLFEIKDICIIHFQCCKRMIDNTKCNYIFDNDESNSFCYFH